MLFVIQNPVIVNRNADFFYKTIRLDSICDSNRFESRIRMLYYLRQDCILTYKLSR